MYATGAEPGERRLRSDPLCRGSSRSPHVCSDFFIFRIFLFSHFPTWWLAAQVSMTSVRLLITANPHRLINKFVQFQRTRKPSCSMPAAAEVAAVAAEARYRRRSSLPELAGAPRRREMASMATRRAARARGAMATTRARRNSTTRPSSSSSCITVTSTRPVCTEAAPPPRITTSSPSTSSSSSSTFTGSLAWAIPWPGDSGRADPIWSTSSWCYRLCRPVSPINHKTA